MAWQGVVANTICDSAASKSLRGGVAAEDLWPIEGAVRRLRHEPTDAWCKAGGSLLYLVVAIGLLLLTLGYGLSVPLVHAATCTKGVNCYCDRVQGGDLNDPLLLRCEDWDHNDWYLDGPAAWYVGDANPPNHNRGNLSKWKVTYGQGAGCLVPNNTPASPRKGQTCDVPGFLFCTGGTEYTSLHQGNAIDSGGRDAWGPGVNTTACVDMIGHSSDAADEVSTLTLTGGNSAGGVVFDGNYSMGYRVPVGQAGSIIGEANWSAKTEIGITMALAYSSNMASISLIDDPWKHDEWGGPNSDPGAFYEGWNLFNTGAGENDVFPYRGFMFHTSQSACNTALTSANKILGQFGCSDDALLLGAATSAYQQATNFPFGTWGCHQAHISGMGTTNTTIKYWHNGVLIMHLTGFNGTVLQNKSYDFVKLNAYANANQGGPGDTPTTQTGYRYQDNIHVRNGAPVSCAQIGFGSGGGVPPPPGGTPPPQGGQGSGCFIATAAFGSPLAREVRVLQEFRDRLLLKNAPGRFVVGAYYWLSPPLARVIAMHEGARAAARGLLWPVVWAAQLALLSPALALVGGGLMATLLFVILLHLGWRVGIFSRRKASRARAAAFPPPVPASEHTQV